MTLPGIRSPPLLLLVFYAYFQRSGYHNNQGRLVTPRFLMRSFLSAYEFARTMLRRLLSIFAPKYCQEGIGKLPVRRYANVNKRTGPLRGSSQAVFRKVSERGVFSDLPRGDRVLSRPPNQISGMWPLPQKRPMAAPVPSGDSCITHNGKITLPTKR